MQACLQTSFLILEDFKEAGSGCIIFGWLLHLNFLWRNDQKRRITNWNQSKPFFFLVIPWESWKVASLLDLDKFLCPDPTWYLAMPSRGKKFIQGTNFPTLPPLIATGYVQKKKCVHLFGAWVSFLSSMPQEWFPHGFGYISLRYPKTHDSPVPHEIWPWTPPPTFFRTTTDLFALVERFIGVGAIVSLFLVPTKHTWPTSLLGNLATDHSHTFENQHRLGGKVGLCLPLLASSAVCNWNAPRGCAGKKHHTQFAPITLVNWAHRWTLQRWHTTTQHLPYVWFFTSMSKNHLSRWL